MIPAEHNKLARLIFDPYITRIIKKSFSNFYLVNELPEIPIDKYLIITPNHISWWDGFFIDYVVRKKINREMYLMMLESSLKKFWFFKKVGAYSINPDNPRSIVETVRYTDKVLKNIKNFVVTYPQGKIEPFEKRPLEIKEGLKLFVKEAVGKKIVMPIGFKIQYYNDRKPVVICRFGEVLDAKFIIENLNEYKNKFISNLDLLDKASYDKNFTEDLLR